MDVQSLKGYASSLRGFLLTSWMKDDSWKLMKEEILSFTSSLEGYAAHLVAKRKKLTEEDSNGASVGDSMHFQTLPLVKNYPSSLKPLVDELSGKDYYTSVLVCDFAPSDRTEKIHYIHKLEKGLPFRVILYTHSIWGSIGNYHFMWKIP